MFLCRLWVVCVCVCVLTCSIGLIERPPPTLLRRTPVNALGQPRCLHAGAAPRRCCAERGTQERVSASLILCRSVGRIVIVPCPFPFSRRTVRRAGPPFIHSFIPAFIARSDVCGDTAGISPITSHQSPAVRWDGAARAVPGYGRGPSQMSQQDAIACTGLLPLLL